MEDTPYSSHFTGHSSLNSLRLKLKKKPGRVCSVGFYSSMAENYGLETADYYSSIFYGPYRDYWKLIIDKQLEVEADKIFFERYYYQVILLNGSVKKRFNSSEEGFDGDLNLNIPLLLATNTTHIISSKPVKHLEKISKNVFVDGHHDDGDSGIIETMLNSLVSKIPWWGFKLALAKEPINKDAFFSPVPLWIYELDNTFDRGYLVDNAVVLPSDKAVLDALAEQSVSDLRRNVFISSKDGPTGSALSINKVGKGSKEIWGKHYTPDKLSFEVETQRPCFLVVSNNYHPNWTARINGEKAKIYRGNHSFQTIKIGTPGHKEIVFEYKDDLVWYMYLAVPLSVLFYMVSCLIKDGREKEVFICF